uniref:Putative polyprotein n=1 Tax=Albugo laibachii Nc14 TaxID=890382 RepID=F0WGY8_9STRA|nr:putative polyprotein [Albugo laibachii Nc14]|eukprot:CCA20503.1 putative polyprotein [Albugo laibachii Nc14]
MHKISLVLNQLRRVGVDNAITISLNRGAQYWKAPFCVLHYLKSTHEILIVYQGGSGPITAEAFTQPDWGGNIDDSSLFGVMVMIANTPVIFNSNYQIRVAIIRQKPSIWL